MDLHGASEVIVTLSGANRSPAGRSFAALRMT